jgi:quinol monooxygenase YgiN
MSAQAGIQPFRRHGSPKSLSSSPFLDSRLRGSDEQKESANIAPRFCRRAALSDGVKITFEMNLKPEVADEMCARLVDMLPETREFPGCRSVNAYRSDEDPNRIMLIEEWDSKEDYDKYLAWRNRDGMMDAMKDIMTRPAKPDYWPILIA